MVQKVKATTMIYEAPLVKWHNCYNMLFAKAENYNETEVLCLKRIKTDPLFFFSLH